MVEQIGLHHASNLFFSSNHNFLNCCAFFFCEKCCKKLLNQWHKSHSAFYYHITCSCWGICLLGPLPIMMILSSLYYQTDPKQKDQKGRPRLPVENRWTARSVKNPVINPELAYLAPTMTQSNWKWKQIHLRAASVIKHHFDTSFVGEAKFN